MTCNHDHICIVCRHLLDGISTDWIPVGAADTPIPDWLCPTCIAGGATKLTETDLCTVCQDCVRNKQQSGTIHDFNDWTARLVKGGFIVRRK